MEISLGTIIKTIVILLLLLVLYLVRDLILVILVSIVIASAVEPIVLWLRRFKIPRAPAVIGIYVVAFGFIASLLPFFIFPLLSDLSALSGTLPEVLGNIPSFMLKIYYQ